MSRLTRISIFLFFSLTLLYLSWLAITFKINPYDSFSIYLNARGIGTWDVYPSAKWRPHFLPVLLAPLFFLERTLFSTGFAVVVGRLLAVTSFALFLWVMYRLIRLYADKSVALLAVVMCSLNRILIHNVPFTKEDIPASLFTAAAFYFYLKLRKRKSTLIDWLIVSFFVTAAISTRYNLIPVVFGVLFITELSHRPWRGLFRKGVFLFAIPSFFFFLIPSILYAALGDVPWLEAPRHFVNEIFLQMKTFPAEDTPIENYQFLWLACTWPVIVFACLGVWSVWKQKVRGAFFFASWFLLFFLVQTYAFGHKEARYLISIYIPLYYFASYGLLTVVELVSKRFESTSSTFPVKRAVSIGVLVLALSIPVKEAFSEYIRFQDPIYRSTFEQDVCREASELAGDNDLFWLGRMYPLFPKDYMFHPEDEFTYIYHFHHHVCKFYANRKVTMLEGRVATPNEGRSGLFVPSIGQEAEDGDVVIVNVAPSGLGYETKTLPKIQTPLVVQKVKTLIFNLVGKREPNVLAFRSGGVPNSAVEIRVGQSEYIIRGSGIPNGYFELYFIVEDAPFPLAQNFVKVKQNTFSSPYKGSYPPTLRAIQLLAYDKSKVYEHPSAKQ